MITAVIVAGGSGVRMESAVKKQYLTIDRRPILSHTLALFSLHPEIDRIILVVPEDDMAYVNAHVLPHVSMQKPVKLVAGGRERQDSVRNGLSAIPESSGFAVIHDGVRPFVAPELISCCIHKARQTGACILGIPASDTLKVVNDGTQISRTLSRDRIWLAQTPQVFSLELIRKAHADAEAGQIGGTDDASLVERLGMPVDIIPGSRQNIKITTAEDLLLAEGLFSQSNSGRHDTEDS